MCTCGYNESGDYIQCQPHGREEAQERRQALAAAAERGIDRIDSGQYGS